LGFDALFEPAKRLELAAKAADGAAAASTLRQLRRVEAGILRGATSRTEFTGAGA
jgi:hypothetical protein